MVEINKRKYIISLFITIFGLVGLISGTSYAILRGNTRSVNEQLIRAGSVELQLTENFNSIEVGASTMKDSDGLQQETVYEFTIKNIGTVAAKYDLNLTNTAPNGQTALSDQYIRIGLEVNGQEMGPMGLSNVNNIIDSNTINENEIIRYKMRVWFDKSKASQIQSDSTKKAYLSLNVDAKQADYISELSTSPAYRYAATNVSIGEQLVSGTYASTASSLNKQFYLRHNIDSDKVVQASYVCYVLNHNEYCLKGVDTTAYLRNKQVLGDSFGTSNCSEETEGGRTKYSCSSASLSAVAFSDGCVSVSIGQDHCDVDDSGDSSC